VRSLQSSRQGRCQRGKKKERWRGKFAKKGREHWLGEKAQGADDILGGGGSGSIRTQSKRELAKEKKRQGSEHRDQGWRSTGETSNAKKEGKKEKKGGKALRVITQKRTGSKKTAATGCGRGATKELRGGLGGGENEDAPPSRGERVPRESKGVLPRREWKGRKIRKIGGKKSLHRFRGTKTTESIKEKINKR